MRGKRGRLCFAVAAVLVAAYGFAATLEENKEHSSKVRVPDRFRAAPGTNAEPYTDTGWAKEVVHTRTGIEMVFIPAGEFEMGTPASEKDRGGDEGPVHTVRITRPFYLAKYEVTQRQWQKVTGYDAGEFKGVTNPAEQISWYDCREFLVKAGMRLPTEAEWEYACRAGTTTAHYFGDSGSDLGRYAWFDSNSGEKTHEVGGKEPNGWGLYDMHGNVWEWCSDWYDSKYYKSSPRDDPKGPSSGSRRILRGGSWASKVASCRSGARFRYGPARTGIVIGFRPAHSIK